jgi:hypothetical protein
MNIIIRMLKLDTRLHTALYGTSTATQQSSTHESYRCGHQVSRIRVHLPAESTNALSDLPTEIYRAQDTQKLSGNFFSLEVINLRFR